MVTAEVLAGSDSCWSAEMRCAALPASLPYSKSGAPTTRITDATEPACEGKREVTRCVMDSMSLVLKFGGI